MARQESGQNDKPGAQPSVKRNVKDSVFTHLFRDKQYIIQLYQALHPDERDVTEDMIELVTLEPVMVDDIYNDLGFILGGHLLILFDAQSTWSDNIIVRALMYLVQTWHNHIHNNEMDLFTAKAVNIPKPELYVLYTGRQKIEKDVITLSEEFFGGGQCDVEARVHVLTDGQQGDIINQYVVFTRVLDEQIQKYGSTKEAIIETIRICKDRGALAKYLGEQEREVIDIMMDLFDNEQILRAHEKTICAQVRKEGIAEGRTEEKNEMALKMLEENIPLDMVVRISGLSLNEINELKAQLVH